MYCISRGLDENEEHILLLKRAHLQDGTSGLTNQKLLYNPQ
jgi:hypothetical protein